MHEIKKFYKDGGSLFALTIEEVIERLKIDLERPGFLEPAVHDHMLTYYDELVGKQKKIDAYKAAKDRGDTETAEQIRNELTASNEWRKSGSAR